MLMNLYSFRAVIVQLVIMCEAVLLALWASALYKTPTKATAQTVLDA